MKTKVEAFTEYWLQVLAKDGTWQDCGTYKTAEAADIEIGYLQRNNPQGKWRCVLRVTAEQVEVPRRRGRRTYVHVGGG